MIWDPSEVSPSPPENIAAALKILAELAPEDTEPMAELIDMGFFERFDASDIVLPSDEARLLTPKTSAQFIKAGVIDLLADLGIDYTHTFAAHVAAIALIGTGIGIGFYNLFGPDLLIKYYNPFQYGANEGE